MKKSLSITVNSLFDFSLLLYLIFFVLEENTENPIIDVGRWGATALLLASGLLLFLNVVNRFKVSECFVWYLVFVLYALSSSLWARDPAAVFEIAVTFIRILVLLFFISIRIESEQDIRLVLRMFAYSVLFRVIVVFVLMIGQVSITGILSYRFGDMVGYNSNKTAMYCVLALFVLIDEIRNVNNNKFKYFLSIILAGAVLLTGSKKGILGFLVGFSLYLYFNNRGVKKIRALLIISAVLFVAYEAITTIPSLYLTIGYRFEQMFNTFHGQVSGTSTIERMSLIEQGFSIWKNHKLFGVGLNNFSVLQNIYIINGRTYAHCNYIELLADLGVIGTVLYYLYPFRICFKYKIKGSTMLLLKTLTIVILAFDIASVSYNDVFIVLILALSCFAYKEQLEKQSNLDIDSRFEKTNYSSKVNCRI